MSNSEIHQHESSHAQLLTAFRTIYYQMVHNVQEAVTGNAETHRLAQLGDKIDEFNEQVQQVSMFWINTSIGIFIFLAISSLKFLIAMNMEFFARVLRLCKKKSEQPIMKH
jgi:hypothetical protein